MTNPASKPATTATSTHMRTLITLPPSSGYGPSPPACPLAVSSERPGRGRLTCTGTEPPSEGERGGRVVAVLLRQDGPQHLDGSLVERPVVDDHRHPGPHEPLDPFGRRGGTDDHVPPSHQLTQRRALGPAGL